MDRHTLALLHWLSRLRRFPVGMLNFHKEKQDVTYLHIFDTRHGFAASATIIGFNVELSEHPDDKDQMSGEYTTSRECFPRYGVMRRMSDKGKAVRVRTRRGKSAEAV